MKKILAIDDQHDNLTNLEAIIKAHIPNCEVLTAFSGLEGIEIAKAEQPDTILLDIIMPEMDGFETCKRLKKSELTKNIPVVMLTAIKTDSKSRVEGMHLGADAFISKPIDPIELSVQLSLMLRIKDAEDKLRAEKDGLGDTVLQKTLELQESEAKMKSIFRAAPTGIGVTVDRTFQFVNQKFVDISGYTSSELIGQSTRKVYQTDEEHERIGKYKYDQIREIGTGTIETQFLRKDGILVDILLSSTPIDFNDLSKGVTFTATDITERKEAEEALKNSEERLSIIFESAPMAYYLSDIKGTFLDGNKAAEELVGYKKEELIGKNFFKINLLPEISFSIATKAIAKNLLGKKFGPSEILLTHKHGHQIPVEISTYPVKIGDRHIILGNAIDISERKKAEKQIQEREEQYRDLVEKADIAVLKDDVNGRFTYFNEKFTKLFGYTAKEIKKHSIQSLVHPDDVERVMEIHNSHIKGIPGSYRYEFKGLRKDGASIELEVDSALLIENNKIVGTQSYIWDISVRKIAEKKLLAALEKANESDRLKSAFLANISHEIRTPMNGILGFSSLLREPDLSGEKQNKYVDIIEKSGARMLNIINNLVDISKIEAGLMKVMLTSININNEVDELFTFFKPEVEKKNMNLLLKKALPDSKAILETDKQKLNSILINLLKNAIKYTDAGSIEFGYTLDSGALVTEFTGSNELVFYIKDTGIGIPENRKTAVFDRFVQADIEDRDAREGSGLGLSISKAYVELLGGKIWLNSVPNKGSEFYFTIPYNLNPNLEPEKSFSTVDKDPETLLNKLNILIVEDEEFADTFLTELVRGISNKILHAKTGKEAVEITKYNPDIDLILMDIKMQDMNGLEATKKIREFNKEVAIIAQTAYALSGDKEIALKAGCDDYISKPIDPALLYSKIKGLSES